jgi:hypothetical protein
LEEVRDRDQGNPVCKGSPERIKLGYIFGRGKHEALGAGALLVGVYDPKQDIFFIVSKIAVDTKRELVRLYMAFKQRKTDK